MEVEEITYERINLFKCDNISIHHNKKINYDLAKKNEVFIATFN